MTLEVLGAELLGGLCPSVVSGGGVGVLDMSWELSPFMCRSKRCIFLSTYKAFLVSRVARSLNKSTYCMHLFTRDRSFGFGHLRLKIFEEQLIVLQGKRVEKLFYSIVSCGNS